MTKVVDIGAKKADECLFCDGSHQSMKCPRVKFLELYEDGSVAVVEFFEPWPNPPPKAA